MQMRKVCKSGEELIYSENFETRRSVIFGFTVGKCPNKDPGLSGLWSFVFFGVANKKSPGIRGLRFDMVGGRGFEPRTSTV